MGGFSDGSVRYGWLRCDEPNQPGRAAQAGFPGPRFALATPTKGAAQRQEECRAVYLISNQTLQQQGALGWLKLQRGYWVIEGSLHHRLDLSLDEDRRQVHVLQSRWGQPLNLYD